LAAEFRAELIQWTGNAASSTREVSDGQLRKLQAALAKRFPEDVVEAALAAMLGTISAKALDVSTEPGPKRVSGFYNYALKTATSAAERIEKSNLERAAVAAKLKSEVDASAAIQSKRVEADHAIQARRVKAHDEACAKGQAARDKINADRIAEAANAKPNGSAPRQDSRYVIDGEGRKTFAPDAKLRTIEFKPISGADGNMILQEVPEQRSRTSRRPC
jgi:hypothetical protein